ncbi:MAG: MoxR family ATPase [Bdellovibrionales bacterium]|nr:MoxR family ATPase [Bdellovibrionales bacterium]
MKTSPKKPKAAPRKSAIVGRAQEMQSILWAIQSGRHLLVEGAVGVGKTYLVQTVAENLGRKFIRIDGDSRYTEQKLTGSFDPSTALKKGYNWKTFEPGPLVQAMQEGAILFINELNRMPENVQNVMLPALDEGFIQIPHLGTLKAKPGFLVVATQNPREFVATSHLSEALMDRMEWIPLSAQSEAEEIQILEMAILPDSLPSPWLETCVALVRSTRNHPKIKRGASVRAAIALARLLTQVQHLDAETFIRAGTMALANRIELLASSTTGEQYQALIQLIVSDFFQSASETLKKKPSLTGPHANH